MIRLNCFFKAKDGKYDEALNVVKELVAASLKQEGCIAYDVFESSTRKDVFMICETWASQETLEPIPHRNHSSDLFHKSTPAER